MRKIFRTIDFAGTPHPKSLDYPKDLPIPREGEIVHLNGNFGRVCCIKHMTNNDITEIKIICENL